MTGNSADTCRVAAKPRSGTGAGAGFGVLGTEAGCGTGTMVTVATLAEEVAEFASFVTGDAGTSLTAELSIAGGESTARLEGGYCRPRRRVRHLRFLRAAPLPRCSPKRDAEATGGGGVVVWAMGKVLQHVQPARRRSQRRWQVTRIAPRGGR